MMGFMEKRNAILQGIYKNAERNILNLRTHCKRGCLFCFQRQSGDKYPAQGEEVIISLEEYKACFNSFDYDKDIVISGGDIFNYPGIYDILDALIKEIKSRGKNPKIEIISTFADFDISRLSLLKSYDNFFLALSLITFDTSFKNHIMKGAGWTERQTKMLKELIEEGIFRHILIWDFGSEKGLQKDLNILKKCVKKMGEKQPNKKVDIILSYPSSTRFASPLVKKYTENAVKNYSKAVNILRHAFSDIENVRLSVYTIRNLDDEIMPSLKDLTAITSWQEDFNERIRKSYEFCIAENINLDEVGFITASACYSYAKKAFPELNWIYAENKYFGGDIIASSLLTFEDLETAIAGLPYKYYVLSKNIVAETGGEADVLRRTIEDFEKQNNCKTLLF